ncbi:GNAT family N-acetyltransferase [Vibrio sp.]|uniref:GNAT family N-acetyltransferase n=1 Tax=Vibrio sp. TaxID=678 RepID=UPI003D0EED32
MVQLSPLLQDHAEQISKLGVADSQLPYVGTTEEILATVSLDVQPHVICLDGEVVGMFLVDTCYSADYEFCRHPALGFRAFFVDHQFQGQGVAKAALKLLPEYLAERYRDFHQVYLTVNCKNPAAYNCYLKAGFEDTGDHYHGGAAGPQHIMYRQF